MPRCSAHFLNRAACKWSCSFFWNVRAGLSVSWFCTKPPWRQCVLLRLLADTIRFARLKKRQTDLLSESSAPTKIQNLGPLFSFFNITEDRKSDCRCSIRLQRDRNVVNDVGAEVGCRRRLVFVWRRFSVPPPLGLLLGKASVGGWCTHGAWAQQSDDPLFVLRVFDVVLSPRSERELRQLRRCLVRCSGWCRVVQFGGCSSYATCSR